MSEHSSDKQHTARSTADSAKQEARSLKDDVAKTASAAGAKAADAVRDTAEQARDGVADEISSVGDALRRASEELRDGSPQERTFGQMASTLADLSDNVRGKDLGEMVGQISDFARRNPTAFLGGAALLGFAAVRMARASQRDRTDVEQLRAPVGNARPTSPRPTTGMQTHPYASNNSMGDRT